MKNKQSPKHRDCGTGLRCPFQGTRGFHSEPVLPLLRDLGLYTRAVGTHGEVYDPRSTTPSLRDTPSIRNVRSAKPAQNSYSLSLSSGTPGSSPKQDQS